jgi:hypothetical protein
MKSFEAFMAVMFQVEVFWVVTLCSIVVGYCISEVHAASIFRVKWVKQWYPTRTP